MMMILMILMMIKNFKDVKEVHVEVDVQTGNLQRRKVNWVVRMSNFKPEVKKVNKLHLLKLKKPLKDHKMSKKLE